jgi:crossover junction endodeoxyribonuclease RuvC
MFDRPYTVLGVDPGLTRCGYAVISMQSPQVFVARALGVIRTDPSSDIADRLAQLHSDIDSLMVEFEPDAVAVEQVFFQNNVRTAMSVGQASGVVLALGRLRGCEVSQYSPSQVKDSVTGWGGASKQQVQKMVQVRLGLSTLPSPPDAADAAAVALCHCACATSFQRRAQREVGL